MPCFLGEVLFAWKVPLDFMVVQNIIKKKG